MQPSQQLARKDAGTGGVTKQAEQAEQPQPAYILRGHASQINTLCFSKSGRWVLSGDSDGYIAAWSLETFRPFVFARAHESSVLTVLEWEDDKIITHGRDNKIHVFKLPALIPDSVDIPSPSSPTTLQLLYTAEINALGYCKCALLPLTAGHALVAVPAVLDDSLIDVIHLPSCKRVYRSVGKDCFDTKTGTVMALAIYASPASLRIFASYEDGRTALFEQAGSISDFAAGKLGEDEGWQLTLSEKLHKEPTMSVALASNGAQAWVVGADHLVSRYILSDEVSASSARTFKTAYPGRSAVTVRDDDRILAIAGWDGSVRIHSAKSFKPLAVLDYHRGSLYSVAFASVRQGDTSASGSELPLPWLAAAGQDERISLWQLYPPAQT